MAQKILVTGESGSGKTYALRTLDPKSTVIICPDEKQPPFQGWRKNYKMIDEAKGKFNPDTCNYLKTTKWDQIQFLMKYVSDKRSEIKTVVIDTITYAMIGEFMDKAKMTGLKY